MLILGRHEVQQALHGLKNDVLEAVRQAYLSHAAADSDLPHSVFLRFPADERSRIIGLPAYLGGKEPVAGIKWISSFPANIDRGLERASAVIILNDMETGRPIAFLEGATISAWRTAASAALAVRYLPAASDGAGVTLFGCGVINFEILRFLRHVVPGLTCVTLHDLRPERAHRFRERCSVTWPDLTVDVEEDAARATQRSSLVSVATNALCPHLDTRQLAPGTLVLHVSLRDVLPEAITAAANVVDDEGHVLRAQTSVHLAEQQVGNRDFVTATLGQLAARASVEPRDPARVTVFSPFGLGVLDLAVAALVHGAATTAGTGVEVRDFLPEPEGGDD